MRAELERQRALHLGIERARHALFVHARQLARRLRQLGEPLQLLLRLDVARLLAEHAPPGGERRLQILDARLVELGDARQQAPLLRRLALGGEAQLGQIDERMEVVVRLVVRLEHCCRLIARRRRRAPASRAPPWRPRAAGVALGCRREQHLAIARDGALGVAHLALEHAGRLELQLDLARPHRSPRR